MQILLTIHLVGATVAAGLVAAAVAAVVVRKTKSYRPLALAIGAAAVVQVLSGAALAAASSGTLLSFCVRIGLYLSVLAAAELTLLVASRRASLPFPTRFVATSGLASVVLSVVGAALQ